MYACELSSRMISTIASSPARNRRGTSETKRGRETEASEWTYDDVLYWSYTVLGGRMRRVLCTTSTYHYGLCAESMTGSIGIWAQLHSGMTAVHET